MPRDHQLLVGRDDEGRNLAARCADARRAVAVGFAIELDSEPRGVAAYSFPQARAVLADAGREHDRLEAAQRGGERSQLASDPVDKEIDRELRLRGVARFERAHVTRNT